MIDPKRRDDRWQHLLTAAAMLDGGDGPLELLDSALEVFPPTIDPVEDFEGYALRRYLLAVRGSMDGLSRRR